MNNFMLPRPSHGAAHYTPDGNPIPMLGHVDLDPSDVACVRRVLVRWGAVDLADMIGVA